MPSGSTAGRRATRTSPAAGELAETVASVPVTGPASPTRRAAASNPTSGARQPTAGHVVGGHLPANPVIGPRRAPTVVQLRAVDGAGFTSQLGRRQSRTDSTVKLDRTADRQPDGVVAAEHLAATPPRS